MEKGKSPEIGPASSGRAGKVLVIAPESGERERIIRAVTAEGAEIAVAEDLYSGLTEFAREETHDQPGLVVLSLDGLDEEARGFPRNLRFLSPDVRILILVRPWQRGLAAGFLEQGVDRMLGIPYHARELRILARGLLHEGPGEPRRGLPGCDSIMRAFAREQERATRDGGGSTIGLAILELSQAGRNGWTPDSDRAGRRQKEISLVLRDCFRGTDLMCRLGGDRFLVVFTGLPADPDLARDHARDSLDRARGRLREDLLAGEGGVDLPEDAIPGGLALSPHEGKSWEELFRLAEARLGVEQLTADPGGERSREE